MGKWQETVGHGFGTARKAGQKRVHKVTNETDGSVGGTQTEHWDGRVDANVHLKPINLKTQAQGGS